MRRGRSAGRLAAGLLAAGLAAAGGVLAAGAADRSVVVPAASAADQAVVVRDQDGREVARAQLPASGRFALEYRHSYYRVPARESFAADGDGFRMVEVASPSEAVLDYYALAGPKRAGGWMRLLPARTQRFERLPLIATATGRRTLVVEGRRYPLYGGLARHVTIGVE